MSPAPAWTGPRSSTAEVLKVLMASPGKVVPVLDLIKAGWPDRNPAKTQMRVALRVAIYSLRTRGHVIETVKHAGYSYVGPGPQAEEAPCA